MLRIDLASTEQSQRIKFAPFLPSAQCLDRGPCASAYRGAIRSGHSRPTASSGSSHHSGVNPPLSRHLIQLACDRRVQPPRFNVFSRILIRSKPEPHAFCFRGRWKFYARPHPPICAGPALVSFINALHPPSAIGARKDIARYFSISLNGPLTDGELAISSRKRPQKDLGLLYGAAAS